MGAVSEPTTGAPLVLVVEDEPAIADLVRTHLARDGFGVEVVGDGEAALRALGTRRPAAVVLDLDLPGLDGTQVCRRMRETGDATPVVFVTAHDDEVDRVLDLRLGADDHVSKPLRPREVVDRVRAAVRGRGPAPGEGALRVRGVVLDPASREVSVDGLPLDLTATEFDLLQYLMARPGVVCPRERLLVEVWGYPPGTMTRTVDVHVGQLRGKLGEALRVRTVRRVGYAVQP